MSKLSQFGKFTRKFHSGQKISTDPYKEHRTFGWFKYTL